MQEELNAQIKSENFRICKRSELLQGTTVFRCGRWNVSAASSLNKSTSRKLDCAWMDHDKSMAEITMTPTLWTQARSSSGLSSSCSPSMVGTPSTLTISWLTSSPQLRGTCMEIPKDCRVSGDSNYVLQVLHNIHGQKQAGQVWFFYLSRSSRVLGSTSSQLATVYLSGGQHLCALHWWSNPHESKMCRILEDHERHDGSWT